MKRIRITGKPNFLHSGYSCKTDNDGIATTDRQSTYWVDSVNGFFDAHKGHEIYITSELSKEKEDNDKS